mmetsp:Transcript_549/g.735  ORF Transcript_549/g.735 Transcript_549/m.735 type:complete len:339 (+) Transcript_549:1011-2027(+)
MEAKKDTLKITNVPREGVMASQTSLGKLLKQLKFEGSTASSQSSSSLGEHKAKFQSLFSAFESGTLSRQDFAASLQAKLSIAVDPKVERLINSQDCSYSKLVTELGLTAKHGPKRTDYYTNGKVGSVRNSQELTTLAYEEKDKVQSEELSLRIKQYSKGEMSKNEFVNYLNAHEVPVTPEIERKIREHETTQSVNYHSLGRSIFKAMTETPRLIGKPNEKDPTQYAFLNASVPPKTSAETREKMREEALRQELDKLDNGVFSGHKRKLKPPVEDSAALTEWRPEEGAVSVEVNQEKQQKHADIFTWSSSSEAIPVSRKLKLEARAACDSGNILSWGSN